VNRASGWRLDIVLACLVFLAAAFWGGARYARAMHSGPHPFFYQSYFEPAVMTACGKGFVVTQSLPLAPALRAFLLEQADRFSCSDLPADLLVGTTGLYQGPWRYLMTSVAMTWMVVGISWSRLAPLFGVLFGLTTALVFVLCRTVVGRTAAMVCAALLCVSPVQLANLPNLRDYAKAPFTLALIAILIALVLRPLGRRELLALSACYGVVLGIGYGFRTDLLIEIPPFLVVIALFLPGGILANLPLKAGAVALCAVCFVFAALPIIRSVTSGGGCQWHFVLLGLSDPFNAPLGVRGGSYGWGHLYRDEYVWATIANFAGRVRPDLGYIEYCSPSYDVASAEYLRRILLTFPADIVTRAYGSALHILELPFDRLGPLRVVGPASATLLVMLASARSVRLALFAVFVLLYFGGHPAIQFLPRHFFVFEFMGWLALAILVEQSARALLRRAAGRPMLPPTLSAGRLLACSLLVIAILNVPLLILRGYQQGRVSDLLTLYAAAPATEMSLTAGEGGEYRAAVHHGDTPPDVMHKIAAMAAVGREQARLLRVTLDPANCKPFTTMTFRYDPVFPQLDFSYTVPVAAGSGGPTTTFEPVFNGFTGIIVSDPSPRCAPRADVVQSDRLPLTLPAQLLPSWRSQAQYQTLVYPR
jgi:hypothetical protein